MSSSADHVRFAAAAETPHVIYPRFWDPTYGRLSGPHNLAVLAGFLLNRSRTALPQLLAIAALLSHFRLFPIFEKYFLAFR